MRLKNVHGSALAVLFISAVFAGSANSFSGEELHEAVTNYQLISEVPELEHGYSSGLYTGYVKGLADVFVMQEKICLSGKNIPLGEVADDVASLVLANDWPRELPPLLAVTHALKELYACEG